MLSLAETRVRIETPRMGGSFGRYLMPGVEAYLALLVHATRQPVRLVLDRSDSFARSTKRHAFRGDYRLGLKRDGTFTALDADILGDAGPYVGLTPTVIAVFADEAAGVVPKYPTYECAPGACSPTISCRRRCAASGRSRLPSVSSRSWRRRHGPWDSTPPRSGAETSASPGRTEVDSRTRIWRTLSGSRSMKWSGGSAAGPRPLRGGGLEEGWPRSKRSMATPTVSMTGRTFGCLRGSTKRSRSKPTLPTRGPAS